MIIVDKEETRVGRKGAERGREREESKVEKECRKERAWKRKKYEMKMGATDGQLVSASPMAYCHSY